MKENECDITALEIKAKILTVAYNNIPYGTREHSFAYSMLYDAKEELKQAQLKDDDLHDRVWELQHPDSL